MLELIIGIYCSFAINYHSCENYLKSCIELHNQMAYEESNYTEIVNEEMSLRSLKECLYLEK